jgi:hypothetical protein
MVSCSPHHRHNANIFYSQPSQGIGTLPEEIKAGGDIHSFGSKLAMQKRILYISMLFIERTYLKCLNKAGMQYTEHLPLQSNLVDNVRRDCVAKMKFPNHFLLE